MSLKENWRVLLFMAALALVLLYGRWFGGEPDTAQSKRQDSKIVPLRLENAA